MCNTYTPYDGSTSPFTMGLRPLALGKWFGLDDHVYTELIKKHRLVTQTKDSVFHAIKAPKARKTTLKNALSRVKSIGMLILKRTLFFWRGFWFKMISTSSHQRRKGHS